MSLSPQWLTKTMKSISLGRGIIGYPVHMQEILDQLAENERILARAKLEFPDLF